MSATAIAIGVVVIGVILILMLAALFISRLYRKVEQGKALIVNKTRDNHVTFTGAVVLPVIHKAEVLDISVKTITIDRRGRDGLICQDNIRADISVNFFIEVNRTKEDVMRVAQIGVARASSIETLNELFNAKFAEALKTAGRQIDFADLYTKRQEFRDAIMQLVGRDLGGYVLTDVAIDYLEQTSLSSLDPHNILDAIGIKKITDLTARENVLTNSLRNEERKAITQKNVETREATLELERQQADAEARQKREVESARAREEAATEVIRSEERLRAERARIAADLAVAVESENMEREVAVAEQNRLRVIAVESEKVETARELQVVNRQVETTAAQRALEEEKRGIAEVAERRIAVEKTVAEQEESIKTLRVVEDSRRTREAVVIEAEAEAQAGLVRDIKAAEAAETAAGHLAKQAVIAAQAEADAANLKAAAQIRLAEATRATEAAPGLAQVAVKEAEAGAVEKLGLAEVAVRTAEADAVRVTGEAEGAATEARIKGEAAGLTVKAQAMKALEGVGREHEEFRIQLEADTKVRMAAVEAEVGVAKARAEAVAASLSKAEISIVGGTEMFVDQMMGATAKGRGFDAALNGSGHAQKLLSPYLEGDANLVGELSSALAGMGTEGVQNLTVATLLTRMMQGKQGAERAKLARVVAAVEEAGLSSTQVSDLLR